MVGDAVAFRGQHLPRINRDCGCPAAPGPQAWLDGCAEPPRLPRQADAYLGRLGLRASHPSLARLDGLAGTALWRAGLGRGRRGLNRPDRRFARTRVATAPGRSLRGRGAGALGARAWLAACDRWLWRLCSQSGTSTCSTSWTASMALAGSACLFFCLAVQFLSGGAPGWLGELLWVTAGGVLGFLTFNWPPARIFMGDVGSLCLGLLLAAITVALIDQGILSATACLILLTGLWFDTTYTLCVRIVTRQRVTEAHRSHLYQIDCCAARSTMDNLSLLGFLPAVAAAAGMACASLANLRLALACGRHPALGGGRAVAACRASRPRTTSPRASSARAVRRQSMSKVTA